MKHRTPEELATLPNRRLMRRHDALHKVWQFTPSQNTANRCAARLSVLASAARMQDATPA